MREDETAGWHRRLDGRESEQFRESVKDGEAWRAAVHGVAVRHDSVTERQANTAQSLISLKRGSETAETERGR